MSWLSSIGHTLGSVAKKAAPLVGMIPGVGTLAGGAIGGLGGLLAPGGNIGEALKGGAMGAASGFVGKLPGVQSMLGKVGGALGSAGSAIGSGLGKAGSAVGSAISDTFMPNGKLDLGKIISAAGTVSGLVGQHQQRKSAENYNNSQIDQRNTLMNALMGPQNYNLPDISGQVRDAAAPVQGPQITPANPAAGKSPVLTSGKAPNLNQQASAS